MNSKLIFKYSIKNVERELVDDEMQFWDIKPSTCSPKSGEISLVRAFAIQLVFNTKLKQEIPHSFSPEKSAQLGDVENVASKLSNISYIPAFPSILINMFAGDAKPNQSLIRYWSPNCFKLDGKRKSLPPLISLQENQWKQVTINWLLKFESKARV